MTSPAQPNGRIKSTTPWTDATTRTANERMEEYKTAHPPRRPKPAKDPIFTALAWRSYHIPTYAWCDDWFQYFANNHPLLGICCHHPRHPIRTPMRLLNLFASVVFGLLVTNVIWLFFVLNEDHDADDAVLTISIGDPADATTLAVDVGGTNATANATSSQFHGIGDDIAITEEMVVLWTFGGALHALFDNTIWYLSACVCCLPCHSHDSLERFQRYGTIFMVFTAIAIGAVASLIVLLRASISEDESQADHLEDAGLSTKRDEVDIFGFSDKSSFGFLLSYAVELALALLIYYPLVGTILFSGILGCGKVPILGGRPYEVLQEKKRLERKRRRDARRVRDSTEITDSTLRSSSKV